MSNVLPLESKKAIDARMRARYVLIAGLAVMTGALIAIIALLPSYVAVKIVHMEVIRSLEASEDSLSYKEDQAAASRAQAILTALKPVVSATSSASSAIASAVSVKPAGISITSITYTKETLLLTGTSQGRDAIAAYRAALDQNPLFTEVAIPVASLVGTQEGKLTITLRGAF